jgi:hypothetical protein
MVTDLLEFADVTPFNPEPVAAAGKELLAFGFAAREIKPLLSDVGDLAAAMGKDIGEVGGAFGRLNAGQFGEAFERFRSFGITIKDLRAQGLQFDAGGSYVGSAEKAIDAVRAVIRNKFGGGMEELSRTFQGKLSTMSGYWNAFRRAIGEPVMESLKPLLEGGITALKEYTPEAERFGEALGGAISSITAIAKGGDLGGYLRSVAVEFGGALSAHVTTGLRTSFGVISALGKGIFASGINLLRDPALWEGIRGMVDSLLDRVASGLLSATADAVEKLPVGLRMGADVQGLRDNAKEREKESRMGRAYADENFALIDYDKILAPLAEGSREAGEIFGGGLREAGASLRNFVGEVQSLTAAFLPQAADPSARPSNFAFKRDRQEDETGIRYRDAWSLTTEGAARLSELSKEFVGRMPRMLREEDETGIRYTPITAPPSLPPTTLPPGGLTAASVERMLPGAERQDPERLAQAIANRILNSPLLSGIASDLRTLSTTPAAEGGTW